MIKEVSSPKLKNPIFIAAWPGMGEVAYRAAIFLKEALGCKMFAKLETRRFFKPAAVSVEKGVIDMPTPPAGFFYYYKGKNSPDIIIFLGEVQPPLEHAEALSLMIINFVKKYKAKLMFTFAAKPEAIDHKDISKVWVASTQEGMLKDIGNTDLNILREGQISGLNGIILGVAKKKGIKGVCLLGEIPFYTVQIENPKATTKILETIEKYLKVKLNLTPLQERGKFIEAEIEKLLAYLKGESAPNAPSPVSEEDIDRIKKDLAAYTKLPQSAHEKIEKLFKEAKKDITLANKLKEELDNWNVYKEYEDRFLDLFRKKGRSGETN